ncbi:protein mono-ADP-ribosyltransferase PARP12 [Oryzias melastigma]|uniref:Si:ch73-252i11.1 n=1 Tax=Oryzias melastigma TaxID=30732 RepID=A0A3B3CUG2_ORYME|nr:protein mono-ADP-ribosyltransferase PARP12 [Oryzias melastigma]
MESEILKFICDNQGASDAEFLKYNLCFGDSISEYLSNKDKFELCDLNGQQKVVARTRLKLCRLKNCLGTCGGLHLCKNVLLTGSCSYSRQGRVCHFSHELNSALNESLLREHGLESLSRTELCTLLLQSEATLLPSICHDYNNGEGEFGKCKDMDGCKRLHVCEAYLTRECSCWKTHDFNARQPLRNLRHYGVPDSLIPSLKTIYVHKRALWLADKRAQRGNQHAASGHAVRNPDGGLDSQRRPFQQRGRGGNRGNRGGRGRGAGRSADNRQIKERTGSLSDILANFDDLDLYRGDGQTNVDGHLSSSNSDISVATNDTDTSSESGQRSRRRHRPNLNNPSRGVRGRGGNRGNHQPFQRSRSTVDLTGAATSSEGNGENRQNKVNPSRDKTEICMYFIKGFCKHQEKCFKAHDMMPYRWQVQEGDQWIQLPDNENIEKDYCNPQNSYSTNSPLVHFDTMTSGEKKVRRLSTLNSLIEPNFIHTTEWLWYWQDENGKWNLYASDSSNHRAADINSAQLERKFLDNSRDVVEFTAGSNTYSLSFQDMIQTNKRYGTKRLVSRRPRFISAMEVKEAKKRKPPVSSVSVPNHWDKKQIHESGFSRIPLQRSSDEFKRMEALFSDTMTGFDITKIERIQNKYLWEIFQLQKNKMKTHNGGSDVTEKLLFHGTDNKHIDTICRDNFDWRICGTHGTAYGKGSYFARDAKYSHSYTGNDQLRTIFISHVLIGSYTRGSSEYRRPPSKDGGDVNFYDSCVDNVQNPSIFVVFDKPQIYPEYLIQYRATHPLVGIASQASVFTQAPRPTLPNPPTLQPSSSITAATMAPSFYHSSSHSSTSSTRPATSSPSPTISLVYRSPYASSMSSSSSYQTSPVHRPVQNTSAFSSSTSSSSSHQTSPVHRPVQNSSTFSTTLRAEPVRRQQDSCVVA